MVRADQVAPELPSDSVGPRTGPVSPGPLHRSRFLSGTAEPGLLGLGAQWLRRASGGEGMTQRLIRSDQRGRPCEVQQGERTDDSRGKRLLPAEPKRDQEQAGFVADERGRKSQPERN